jgi:hypothetical protein
MKCEEDKGAEAITTVRKIKAAFKRYRTLAASLISIRRQDLQSAATV